MNPIEEYLIELRQEYERSLEGVQHGLLGARGMQMQINELLRIERNWLEERALETLNNLSHIPSGEARSSAEANAVAEHRQSRQQIRLEQEEVSPERSERATNSTTSVEHRGTDDRGVQRRASHGATPSSQETAQREFVSRYMTIDEIIVKMSQAGLLVEKNTSNYVTAEGIMLSLDTWNETIPTWLNSERRLYSHIHGVSYSGVRSIVDRALVALRIGLRIMRGRRYNARDWNREVDKLVRARPYLQVINNETTAESLRALRNLQFNLSSYQVITILLRSVQREYLTRARREINNLPPSMRQPANDIIDIIEEVTSFIIRWLLFIVGFIGGIIEGLYGLIHGFYFLVELSVRFIWAVITGYAAGVSGNQELQRISNEQLRIIGQIPNNIRTQFAQFKQEFRQASEDEKMIMAGHVFADLLSMIWGSFRAARFTSRSINYNIEGASQVINNPNGFLRPVPVAARGGAPAAAASTGAAAENVGAAAGTLTGASIFFSNASGSNAPSSTPEEQLQEIFGSSWSKVRDPENKLLSLLQGCNRIRYTDCVELALIRDIARDLQTRLLHIIREPRGRRRRDPRLQEIDRTSPDTYRTLRRGGMERIEVTSLDTLNNPLPPGVNQIALRIFRSLKGKILHGQLRGRLPTSEGRYVPPGGEIHLGIIEQQGISRAVLEQASQRAINLLREKGFLHARHKVNGIKIKSINPSNNASTTSVGSWQR